MNDNALLEALARSLIQQLEPVLPAGWEAWWKRRHIEVRGPRFIDRIAILLYPDHLMIRRPELWADTTHAVLDYCDPRLWEQVVDQTLRLILAFEVYQPEDSNGRIE